MAKTEKPVIDLDLSVKSGIVIRARETLRVPATVTGKPYPSITWTINDAKPDKDRVEITAEGNDSVVVIKNVQRKDSGKYHISACNPSGIKGASIRVEVMGEWKSRAEHRCFIADKVQIGDAVKKTNKHEHFCFIFRRSWTRHRPETCCGHSQDDLPELGRP